MKLVISLTTRPAPKEGHRFEIDNLGSKSLQEPKQALESQARELLADQFAFRHFTQDSARNSASPPVSPRHRT